MARRDRVISCLGLVKNQASRLFRYVWEGYYRIKRINALWGHLKAQKRLQVKRASRNLSASFPRYLKFPNLTLLRRKRKDSGVQVPNVRTFQMDTIKSIPDYSVLERLSEALTKGGPIAPSDRLRMIRQAAMDMAASLRSAQELIAFYNDYETISAQLIQHWDDAPYEARMGLREIALSTSRLFQHLDALSSEDRKDLVSAMPEDKRELFAFTNSIYFRMVRDITNAIRGDREVLSSPTADQVWDLIKRLSPAMEDALHRPLDRSKYVERNLEKTPRRRRPTG